MISLSLFSQGLDEESRDYLSLYLLLMQCNKNEVPSREDSAHFQLNNSNKSIVDCSGSSQVQVFHSEC